MVEHSSHAQPSTSPWPFLVAVGFVLSEVGIFVNLVPIAIGGILLLAWAVGGVLTESGYVSAQWPAMAAIGAAFVLLGGVVYGLGVGIVPAGSATGELIGLSSRGLSMMAAGVLAVVAAAVGRRRR